MYKLYIKQAWAILKENRIISSLSIAGTALSIAAIMLVVLVYQVIYADYAPENHRFRTLYVDAFQAGSKTEQGSNRGQMGVRVLRECLYDLKIPEAVTGISMALVLCILLNMLSALIPAFRSLRSPIVKSLNEKR